jgi:hypothetical protein
MDTQGGSSREREQHRSEVLHLHASMRVAIRGVLTRVTITYYLSTELIALGKLGKVGRRKHCVLCIIPWCKVLLPPGPHSLALGGTGF